MFYIKRITGYSFVLIAFFVLTSCFVFTWLLINNAAAHHKSDDWGNASVSEGLNTFPAAYPAVCGSVTDIAKCAPSVQLNAEPGQSNYIWSTGATTPSIIVNASGTYWWETVDLTNNKVNNGDFSANTAGITSDYTYKNPNTNTQGNLLQAEGTYTVTTNPRNVHSGFSPFTDHTGNGSMLVVNGAPTAGKFVWKQTINVQANTDYVFSIWSASAHPTNPGQLYFSINGNPEGNIQLSSTTGLWQQFTARWSSGSNVSATIGIVNQNTATSGNDFAIDDIVFAPVCRNTFNVTIYPNPAKPFITPQ